jgi:hypothetical protein
MRLAGRRPKPGARAAIGELRLEDYELLFARRSIVTGIRCDGTGTNLPLYARLLGDAFERLPEPLKRMHEVRGAVNAEGLASVERGPNPVAWLIASLFRFPAPGRDVPVQVRLEQKGGREIWERSFAGRRFTSLQSEGIDQEDRLLVETFGPFTFAMALVVEEGRLRLVVRNWRFLGMRLPLMLGPREDVHETAIDGRFHFYVDIRLPLIGRIVRYRGWLIPQPRSDGLTGTDRSGTSPRSPSDEPLPLAAGSSPY